MLKKILVITSICLCISSQVQARELPEQQEKVANKIANTCIEKWEEYGILPSVAVSQSFIESTLGQNPCNSYNYFGLKRKGSTSQYASFSSLDNGIFGYLDTIKYSGYYKDVPFCKSYEKQLFRILYDYRNGKRVDVYCQPAGSYYSQALWSIRTYNFDKYDNILFSKLKKEKHEKWRKKQLRKKWTLIYDPTVPDYEARVPKSIVKKNTTIQALIGNYSIIYGTIQDDSIKGREIHVNIPNISYKEFDVNFIENVKG